MFKPVQIVLSLVVGAFVLIVSILNMAKMVLLTFLGEQVFSLPLGVVLITGFALGLVSLLPLLMGIKAQAQSKVSFSQHQKEKAQVQSEASQDQIKALESKIQTLEVALNKALKS